VLGIFFGSENIFKELGLQKGFLFGLGFSFVAVLPTLTVIATIIYRKKQGKFQINNKNLT